MSAFVDELQSISTNIRTARTTKLDYCIEHESPLAFSTNIRRRIVTKFERVINCLPEDVEVVMQSVEKELRHIIYGDFVVMLQELYRAVYAMDEIEARELINKILMEVGG